MEIENKHVNHEEQASGQSIDEARKHYSRGVAFLKLGRFEEALSELDKALSLDPGNERYRLVKVAALVGLERFEDAKNELKSILPNYNASSSISNSSHASSIGPNGIANGVNPTVNGLGHRLMNYLWVVSVLLIRIVSYLAALFNGLVARFSALLGLARARLTRIIRLRGRGHRDAA